MIGNHVCLEKGIEGSNPSLSTILRQGFVWRGHFFNGIDIGKVDDLAG